VPANERGVVDEPVPEFEIDAQAVSWSQYAEFVEDGGYDQRSWWDDSGWAWVQARQRRCPRDVEQMRHGVVLRRFGRVQRVPATLPVSGVSRHEAEAWCRWAGRSLPTQPEWTIAARQGASRGFVWGGVAEWVLGRAPPPQSPRAVQRGVPWLAPRRLAHPDARRFVDAGSDDGFVGFRSCSR
jgi:formylglycine-generating enzyme required for sulfatase activity